ncbi:hypothetical protein [Peribacillus frigoritolerans]|uniref:hypothetical protein n=1 Tax=Peribacillus frigoritolerans TaxID=450367 RepID=UPI001F5038BE|nr:hypothetical protein [Peribacillus frigoritolerans]MCK2020779.1 hypothetical protein [Peribacillus frigoritolerans]
MGLFTKKTNELEALQGQEGKLQGKSQELQAKINQIQNGLAIAETNLMIDETAANKKQVEKFKVAIEKTQKELEAVGVELSEVASQIGAINEAEKQAKIDEAASSIEQDTYLAHKRRKMEMKAEELVNRLHGRSGYGYSTEMKRLAGVKSTDQLDPAKLEHTRFIDASNKASASGIAKAEREFEKLVAQIEAFIELN